MAGRAPFRQIRGARLEEAAREVFEEVGDREVLEGGIADLGRQVARSARSRRPCRRRSWGGSWWGRGRAGRCCCG